MSILLEIRELAKDYVLEKELETNDSREDIFCTVVNEHLHILKYYGQSVFDTKFELVKNFETKAEHLEKYRKNQLKDIINKVEIAILRRQGKYL